MKRRLTGLHDRLLSALALSLSVVLLGVVAATLKPSISTTAAPTPPTSGSGSDFSLLALLYRLINAVLSAFGISLERPSGQASGSSILNFVFVILQTIYQYRLTIITSIGLLVILGLLYQYRHHLALRVRQSPDETSNTTSPSTDTDGQRNSWPPTPDSDADSVQEAWVRMIRHVDDTVDEPASRTPTEWQAIAISHGLPADLVETITATFRAIQYGPTTETASHRDRVQTALSALETHQEATDE
jgi:hypothetical protein